MGLAARYADALFPDPVRILGLAMQPYCIGHALLLHRVRSPFVYAQPGPEQDPPTPDNGVGDLLLALYICSRPWQAGASGIRSRGVRFLMKLWGWQLRRGNPLRSAMAVVAAEGQFRQYLSRAWDSPDLWDKEHKDGGAKAGAPFLAALKVSLCAMFGWTHDQALSTPVSVALYDTAAWGEAQGSNEWVSDEQIAAMEVAARS